MGSRGLAGAACSRGASVHAQDHRPGRSRAQPVINSKALKPLVEVISKMQCTRILEVGREPTALRLRRILASGTAGCQGSRAPWLPAALTRLGRWRRGVLGVLGRSPYSDPNGMQNGLPCSIFYASDQYFTYFWGPGNRESSLRVNSTGCERMPLHHSYSGTCQERPLLLGPILQLLPSESQALGGCSSPGTQRIPGAEAPRKELTPSQSSSWSFTAAYPPASRPSPKDTT